MSVSELCNRLLKEGESVEKLDWLKARKEIHEEHRRAGSTAERVACLDVYTSVMDAVEANLPRESLEEFRKTRMWDYRILLISEAMIDAPENLAECPFPIPTLGKVSPAKLAEITSREVAQGRLSSGDDLHALALDWQNQVLGVRKQKSRGILAMLRFWKTSVQ